MPDGKILAGGGTFVNNGHAFYTFRLTTSGALNTSLNGTGKAYTDFQSNSNVVYNYFLASDGRITAVGFSQSPTFGVGLAPYWP